MSHPAKLALADGTVYAGQGFGARGEVYGELVFNTSMTGYQEILSDPSYAGQIVTMTYPLIGNYGVNAEDVESAGLSLSGFVIRELCRRPSNQRCEQTLDAYLSAANVIGLQGIDTRSLVRRIRMRGAVTGVLSTEDLDDASLVAKAIASPELTGVDLVDQVIPNAVSEWDETLSELARPSTLESPAADSSTVSLHVVAIDYGMKWNIARHLKQMGCRVTIVPGNATADAVLGLEPDGVFLSNGPGDPRPLDYAIQTIRELIQHKPVFGICLGHQLLGLALGGTIFKMKFGHHGANQPVRNHRTQRVEITSQNHGFALEDGSLSSELEVTHTNLNDNTIEGIRHRERPVFGVQYHPEAAAGPHDSHYLFGEFYNQMVDGD
ncbi:MAG: glutamine-hydrolyzing carbamoyl-phosphate synthase small subunit [Planctomycetaceae bacterium]